MEISESGDEGKRAKCRHGVKLEEDVRENNSISSSTAVAWLMVLTILVTAFATSLYCYVALRNYGQGVAEFKRQLELFENNFDLIKTIPDFEKVKKKDVVVSASSVVNGERIKRDVSEDGDENVAGPRGFYGLDGHPGIPGRDGRDGITGMPGVPGTPGAAGPIGPRGDPGPKGEVGSPGLPGSKGDIGNSGLPGLRGDFGQCCYDQSAPGSSILTAVHEAGYDGSVRRDDMQRNSSSSSSSLGHSNQPLTTGSVYVRWGRTTCPNTGAELVYAGLAAGSHFSHNGGSTSYECLPTDPEWENFNDAWNSKAYIYGAEYETSTFDPFSHENSFSAPIHNGAVPCALCRVPTRGVKVMMAAKTICPEKWTKEYSGYLMASKFDQLAQYLFECVDESPEVRPGTNTNQDGAQFYLIESHCGSLPCAPYVNGRELTCVVCTI
ncbi:short-chain collagen C4-like [Ptychodera flava]|uniref:short-chain collagen C4-like n=1 Tax=Ptychodera flava TaxID=63121 RepID=UPI00396A098C